MYNTMDKFKSEAVVVEQDGVARALSSSSRSISSSSMDQDDLALAKIGYKNVSVGFCCFLGVYIPSLIAWLVRQSCSVAVE